MSEEANENRENPTASNLCSLLNAEKCDNMQRVKSPTTGQENNLGHTITTKIECNSESKLRFHASQLYECRDERTANQSQDEDTVFYEATTKHSR